MYTTEVEETKENTHLAIQHKFIEHLVCARHCDGPQLIQLWSIMVAILIEFTV